MDNPAFASGSFLYPAITGTISPTSQFEVDRAVSDLQEHKDDWVRLSIPDRLALIDELIHDFYSVSPRWVDAGLDPRGIRNNHAAIGTEWFVGPYITLRNLRSLRRSLKDIQSFGHPKVSGAVKVNRFQQVVVSPFPADLYDRLMFQGYQSEVWMQPGITPDSLPKTQAIAYRENPLPGKVALVLGGGNVSSIPTSDVLYKLFVENQVIILKMNPVNDYLGPLIEEGFKSLIVRGFLRVVYGGGLEGAYLCNHPGIEEIHITGSDKTFDQIVFGPGAEGARRKQERKPLLSKRITGELGNVTPIIVIPGPWSKEDIDYQAENIVSWMCENAGYNCNSPRVMIQHAQSPLRGLLLDQIRNQLSALPLRKAFYPGAQERYHRFLETHSEAECYGNPASDQLPWTLIPGLAPGNPTEICFTTEAFCPVMGETAMEAANIPEFIEKAVQFANQSLWGTLCATILVHPTSLKDPAIHEAVGKAIADLHYGTVALNIPAGTAYLITELPWGAYPVSSIFDIQSGVGVVHNTLMFSYSQKTVLRAPFRQHPTPPTFVSQGEIIYKTGPKIVAFGENPSIKRMLSVLWTVIRG